VQLSARDEEAEPRVALRADHELRDENDLMGSFIPAVRRRPERGFEHWFRLPHFPIGTFTAAATSSAASSSSSSSSSLSASLSTSLEPSSSAWATYASSAALATGHRRRHLDHMLVAASGYSNCRHAFRQGRVPPGGDIARLAGVLPGMCQRRRRVLRSGRNGP